MKTLLDKSKRIVVFTGAGISTNSGIPDFRGQGGLYETVQTKYGLPYGEAIFDIKYFDKDPHPFFDLSKKLITGQTEPTKCHKWLAHLEEKGRVVKVITQNIDRLHQRAGTKSLFECHGTYDKGHCRSCHREYSFEYYAQDLAEGNIPYCTCGGIVKPDIVFFGESLPKDFYELWENTPQGDLLLILGTSLNVRPAADLVFKLARQMTSILVNKERTEYDKLMDYVVHQDLDLFVQEMGGL
jgi:NAD+-dependent protein deacetylase sirtuin 2